VAEWVASIKTAFAPLDAIERAKPRIKPNDLIVI
jgi:hypothetical protein